MRNPNVTLKDLYEFFNEVKAKAYSKDVIPYNLFVNSVGGYHKDIIDIFSFPDLPDYINLIIVVVKDNSILVSRNNNFHLNFEFIIPDFYGNRVYQYLIYKESDLSKYDIVKEIVSWKFELDMSFRYISFPANLMICGSILSKLYGTEFDTNEMKELFKADFDDYELVYEIDYDGLRKDMNKTFSSIPECFHVFHMHSKPCSDKLYPILVKEEENSKRYKALRKTKEKVEDNNE